ncbi:L-threonylcarbamoyladenylate synthase [uncultured Roseobacter sp.]|uniref:L-threonylcarbamoyladenylate synthase n=1 Tax=uncultured Roseobacter sp. TaxID=114847 RepID=UPI00260E804B|nr:L-threonylcarbamoyladenylate synthase [uncultured Roseobacter sp.]
MTDPSRTRIDTTLARPERLSPDAGGIARAATLLEQGALVAWPTETVYGLGADARNGAAVAAIYAAKGRPSFNPLIVHLPEAQAAFTYAEWTADAARLAAAFWPGPLTLVLPLRADHGLSELVTAGLPSVALRVPAQPTARALLRAFGGPVAAPSANPSGRISPTSADHVLEGLGGRIAAVLDDGACPVGVESTIVGLTGTPALLRPGGLPVEALEAALGAPLLRPGPPDAHSVTAPGQLASHYAPRAPLRMNADAARPGELMLGFGPMACDANLSDRGDLQEAAANLFALLHRLDASGQPIAVAPVPMAGLGRAINDRLARAAAPRPDDPPET